MTVKRTAFRIGQRVFVNTDAYTRSWHDLQDPLSGQTLSLEPEQAIALDVPDNFNDPWLKEISSLRNRQKRGESASRYGKEA